MTAAAPVPTKGQALKNLLEQLFNAPEQFDASPICHPNTLNRILGEQYAVLIADNLSPHDLAMDGLKQITAQRIVEAVQQDDQRLAEGLVLIWHQYLAPILSGSARSISPVARVLIYCAQPDNLGGMWTEIEKMKEGSGRAIQRIPLFRDLTDNGHGLEHTAKKQRRTYANYIQRAFETLGKADELAGIWDAAAVPYDVEIGGLRLPTLNVEITSEETPELAVQPSALGMLVAYILDHCHHLPLACGRTLPTSWVIERAIEARSVKGEALRPNVTPGTADDVKRMSGMLVGVPGSGRTSFLYRIAYSWANAYSYGQPLAVYIRAPEFLIYARNRRSVYEFAARQVLPNSSRDEIAQLGKELEEYEQIYGLLWLVDDLDRLSESDQSEVIMQLALSPAVLYAALSWEADRVAHQMYQPDVGVFDLRELSEGQQKEMLMGLCAQHPKARINPLLAELALLEAPYLAKLPLGILAVFDQLATGTADRVHIVQQALEEYFERACLPRPQFTGEWLTLDSAARSLLVMATVAGADILWYKDESIFTSRARFEQGNGWTPECLWEILVKTRLFEPHPKYTDVCRYFNWDILGYLIAKSEAARLFTHPEVCLSSTPTQLTAFVLHTKRHVEVAQL